MSFNNIFVNARRDLHYLNKNYAYNALFLMGLNYLAFSFVQRGEFSLQLWHLFVPFIAIPFAWSVSSLIHNAAHGNIFGSWINRMVGELCGLALFYGLPSFALIHILHHKMPDEEGDPVSPKGMSFLKFAFAPNRYVKKKTVQYQRELFGDDPAFERTMSLQNIGFNVNYLLRVTFWYFVLGPELFLVYQIPFIISSVLILAHINYINHRNLPDGSVEVVNYNHNLYYKVANFFSFGGYYHKAHHLNQKLFNPQRATDNGTRMFTIGPRSEVEVQGIPEFEIDPLNLKEKLYRFLKVDTVWGEAEKYRLQRKNAGGLRIFSMP